YGERQRVVLALLQGDGLDVGPRERACTDLERYGQLAGGDGLRHDDALIGGRAVLVRLGSCSESALVSEDVDSGRSGDDHSTVVLVGSLHGLELVAGVGAADGKIGDVGSVVQLRIYLIELVGQVERHVELRQCVVEVDDQFAVLQQCLLGRRVGNGLSRHGQQVLLLQKGLGALVGSHGEAGTVDELSVGECLTLLVGGGHGDALRVVLPEHTLQGRPLRAIVLYGIEVAVDARVRVDNHHLELLVGLVQVAAGDASAGFCICSIIQVGGEADYTILRELRLLLYGLDSIVAGTCRQRHSCCSCEENVFDFHNGIALN
ncbi:hypothetical protein SAMN05444375_1321, partial [Segatella baroniae B14]